MTETSNPHVAPLSERSLLTASKKDLNDFFEIDEDEAIFIMSQPSPKRSQEELKYVYSHEVMQQCRSHPVAKERPEKLHRLFVINEPGNLNQIRLQEEATLRSQRYRKNHGNGEFETPSGQNRKKKPVTAPGDWRHKHQKKPTRNYRQQVLENHRSENLFGSPEERAIGATGVRTRSTSGDGGSSTADLTRSNPRFSKEQNRKLNKPPLRMSGEWKPYESAGPNEEGSSVNIDNVDLTVLQQSRGSPTLGALISPRDEDRTMIDSSPVSSPKSPSHLLSYPLFAPNSTPPIERRRREQLPPSKFAPKKLF